MTGENTRISAAQRQFAAMLAIGMYCGLVVLALGFVAYILDWLPATVRLDALPRFWSLSAADYRQSTGAPDGWGWLTHYSAGEILPLAGIVILCSTVLLGFIVLAASSALRRDWAYFAIALFEVAVLVLAASGLLTVH